MTIYYEGLLIGISTFLIIGAFHPIVIKCEFYTGTRLWWVFVLVGVAGITAALFISDTFWSSLLGVFSFSSLWSVKELFEQRERVKKGWFPKNPKREY